MQGKCPQKRNSDLPEFTAWRWTHGNDHPSLFQYFLSVNLRGLQWPGKKGVIKWQDGTSVESPGLFPRVNDLDYKYKGDNVFRSVLVTLTGLQMSVRESSAGLWHSVLCIKLTQTFLCYASFICNCQVTSKCWKFVIVWLSVSNSPF